MNQAERPDAVLAAALADRYRIERELGQGGMATVYLAHDLRHDRPVAIKVLRDDVAQTLGAERFLREIQLAARLSHPGVLPLFDSGRAGNVLFYVMPHVEGGSVRNRLDREGQLPVAEVVRIGAEVAEALDSAHRQGVVHRDIKPENILLQDGHARVADFGIGKALSAVEGEAVTRTGMSVGTPAYMSPEQAAGEVVDGRSDLYSLGCVLYEMLVGEPPFTGNTVQAVIAKRFIQTPADVSGLREGVPRPVARAVHRALARTAIDRYETGAQLAAALMEPEAAPDPRQAAPEKSIAVLPFITLSPDPEDGFLADGVTEEILNALAQIPGLRVAGRSSVFSFKGRTEDPRTVGAKLNVANVLEGTMRRAGSRLRVTAQLTSAADGYQLWSEKYDRVLEDVFAVQDEIAGAIAGRLRLSLDQGKAAGSAPPTQHLEAYQLYLKGRALLYQRGRSIAAARECFQQAVALDPEYAQAWAGLADAYTTSGYSAYFPAAEVMPQAIDAARRALALAPDLAEAHNALACATLLWERDYATAEREFRRAIELNPGYVQARAWYGLFYLHWIAGKVEEGEEQIARGLEVDPLSGYSHFLMGFLLLSSGRAREAVASCRRGVELDPNSYLGTWSLGCALGVVEEYGEAIAVMERALAMSGRHVWALATLAAILARAGKADDARAVMQEAAARGAREYLQPSMMAAAAVAVEGMDAGIAWVRRALEERDPLFVSMARSWPYYDPLRPDPRFQAILAMLQSPK
jgi:serine/threonine-protein kinase